ncbi:putative ATPase/histidine kinase/DNA gyrase B/HSP90 domain protein [uncultured Desulfobacterium sp.]|uniref:histidine kinase n=1 Tax=uncultured Desulfobacterium sp. TaxID=201089 RepID=A0A445MT39_9BACT|nr:putative ATPase/histidine kinase/DNA gyrase B/HSP90 domain protein [uncultured Desulfobacterium sp.]
MKLSEEKNESFEEPGETSKIPLMVDDASINEVQRGLAERPTMSVRAKIIMGFVVLFILSAGASITFLVLGSRIDQKVKFMETGNNFSFEIQQARRFEKNYFLYKTNLLDALENAQNAIELLKIQKANISRVIGTEKWQIMMDHINRYEKLLENLRTQKNDETSNKLNYDETEAELRRHGAKMIALAANLVEQERKEVEDLSKLCGQIPLVFLALLLILMIYLTNFLARQIVRPLNRFVEYTRRIAQGDYSLITPTKRYKDEFSRLAIAINWMLDQLQKNQEQYIQSRKMAAIGTLTSGIAHELNNPLNNICITTESLLDELEELSQDEKRKRLNDVYAQAERASGTVRDLLDFTRIDQPSFVTVSVDELISSTLKLVKHEMELNNVEPNYTPSNELNKIKGDFSQLQQVFLNLMINSIQAMPRGGVLGVSIDHGDPELIRIDVGDTGIGIPQAVISQIFDPFFTTKEKGTGLGLSVSYSIIRKHGGKILVKSQINQGTTFSVYLPKSKEHT